MNGSIRLQHLDTKVKKFDVTNNMASSMPKLKVDGLTAVIKQWAPASDEEIPSAVDFGVPGSDTAETSLLPDLDIRTIDLSNILVQYQDASSRSEERRVGKECKSRGRTYDSKTNMRQN